jgi:hypothetical protein
MRLCTAVILSALIWIVTRRIIRIRGQEISWLSKLGNKDVLSFLVLSPIAMWCLPFIYYFIKTTFLSLLLSLLKLLLTVTYALCVVGLAAMAIILSVAAFSEKPRWVWWVVGLPISLIIELLIILLTSPPE